MRILPRRVFTLIELLVVIGIITLLLGMLAACVIAASSGINGADEENAARAACLACQANLSSFSSYECRFTYSKAETPSLEKARGGEYQNVRKCDFLLAVDGDQEKFQSTTDLKTEAPKDLPPGGFYSLEFLPIAHLRRGQEGLRYYSRWNTAKLNDKEHPRAEQAISKPLSMNVLGNDGHWSPTALLGYCAKGHASLSSRGTIAFEGQPAVHALFAGKQWGEIEFYFDPSRGYAPLMVSKRLISPEGKRYTESRTYLLEARGCSKQRWFPTHTATVHFPEAPGKLHSIVDLRVTELDVEGKVTDDDLAIEIPAGTVVHWDPAELHLKQYFQLHQDEKIRPKDLPRIAAMLEQSEKTRAAGPAVLMDTAIRDYSSSGSTKWVLMGAGLAILGASFFVYRRYRVR